MRFPDKLVLVAEKMGIPLNRRQDVAYSNIFDAFLPATIEAARELKVRGLKVSVVAFGGENYHIENFPGESNGVDVSLDKWMMRIGLDMSKMRIGERKKVEQDFWNVIEEVRSGRRIVLEESEVMAQKINESRISGQRGRVSLTDL